MRNYPDQIETRLKLNYFMERDREIIVYLRGGLGNQLFQYFAGKKLAERLERRLILQTSLLPEYPFTDKRGISVFPDSIGKLNHSGEMRRSRLYKILPEKFVLFLLTRLAQVDRQVGGLIPKIWTKLGRLSSNNSFDLDSVNQSLFHIVLNSPCLEYSLNKSWLRQHIQHLFTPKENMSSWFLNAVKQNLESKPVSIHIRLGDHLRLEPNLDFSYYARARDWIDRFRPNSPMWIFSDEPIKAREFLADIFPEAQFVQTDEMSDEIESFIVMASSPVLVCGRSTYSLWVSELVSSRNGTVVGDVEWVQNENAPGYLGRFSEDWILI